MRVRSNRRAPPAAVDDVIEQLRSYATRGVFREFSVTTLSPQRTDFRFVWLTAKPVLARYDARTSVFTLVELLPNIPPRSAMDRALRDFVRNRYSTTLPPHRRLSRSLIPAVACINRNRHVSLRLTLNRRRAAPAAKQAVHLLSELFHTFLVGPYHEYMVRNFDARED